MANIPASWLVSLIEYVLIGAGFLALYAVLALILIYFERRICAFFQCRLGPNRVGPFGVFQVIADMVKILLKEIISVKHIDKVLFYSAFFIVIMGSFLTFGGLQFAKGVHGADFNIGVFYLLYRAAEYPEYKENREDLLSLVIGWHESIGESLLAALGIPEHITQAIREHDQLRHVETPSSLADVLYFANLLAGGNYEWLGCDTGVYDTEQAVADRARYTDLLDEAWDDIREIQAALSC